MAQEKTLISAHIATTPERKKSLKKVVNSLIGQIDTLFITLNNYSQIPEYLANNKKIRCKLANNTRGSNEKISQLQKGWIFLCDDDIIYPKNYIKNTLLKIGSRRGVFSYHGFIIKNRPISSYCNDRKHYYHFNKKMSTTTKVDIAGTGVMAFHSNVFYPEIKNYKYPNMTDIFTSLEAKKQHVDLYVLDHIEDYFISLKQKSSIWDRSKDNDLKQTELINAFF